MQDASQPVAPRWAGRVPRHKIARLYENDARGIVDEELIDEVGYALLDRCQSILTATEAHKGRAKCPGCGNAVDHDWNPRAVLLCERCGWQGTWRAYHKSYQGRHLYAGGMAAAFREYVERFPLTKTPRERMVQIDRLIHRFHWELRADQGRSGAVGLIGGRPHEVVAFLDQLSYGDDTMPELRRTHAEWWKRQRQNEERRRRKEEARRQHRRA